MCREGVPRNAQLWPTYTCKKMMWSSSNVMVKNRYMHRARGWWFDVFIRNVNKVTSVRPFLRLFFVVLANSTYKPKKLKTNKTHLSLLVSWRVVTFIFETDYLSILSAHASVVPRSAVNSRSKPRRSFSTPLIRPPFPLLDPPTSSASCFFLSRLRAREQRITTRRRDFQPPNCRLFLVGHYPSFNSLSFNRRTSSNQ